MNERPKSAAEVRMSGFVAKNSVRLGLLSGIVRWLVFRTAIWRAARVFIRGSIPTTILALHVGLSVPAIWAQQLPAAKLSSASDSGASIQGLVVGVAGGPVSDAKIMLEQKGEAGTVTTKTDQAGNFALSGLGSGTYFVRAESGGLRSAIVSVTVQPGAATVNLKLQLFDPKAGARADSGNPAGTTPGSNLTPTSNQTMEFADQPNFTVAGVTDWTAVGGHGSDAILRTSETLAREALTLKADSSGASKTGTGRGSADPSTAESDLRAKLAAAPGSSTANHALGEFLLRQGRYEEAVPLLQKSYDANPADVASEYDLALAERGTGAAKEAQEHVRKLLASQPNADVHRLAGEIEEQLGDPLAAVREYEQAVRMEPSEQNYYAWGSELLLHRAVWQAQEVFKKGTKEFPKSARMLSALGSALFASALYDDAALRLCEASDLNPGDPLPYKFMGKIELAAPTLLPCIEQKLARYAQDNRGNAEAQYLYAMAIWKRQAQPADTHDLELVETLLTKAVQLDNQCGDGYLQLGVLRSVQHKPDEAVNFYRKAIEVNPQLGEAHYRLGVAYDRMGESAKAKEQFQLHDEIEKAQADAIEEQRREVKQFLIVLQGQNGSGQAN